MTKALDESLVRDALRQVRWPDVAKDIVACGLLKKIEITADRVKVSVEEPTMVVAPPVREAFETQIRRTVESVAAGRAVDLETSVRVVAMPAPADKNRLPRVKNVIAVASGKGGVGKSTVATNLALALQKWGARVGMVDCDIFGPSVPQMLGVEQRAAIGTAEKKIAPALYFDMPVMSVAFFVEKADAVVWRGPMVHKLLTQFMEDVEWGELDYLVYN